MYIHIESDEPCFDFNVNTDKKDVFISIESDIVTEIEPFIRTKLDTSANHCQELTTNVITMPIPQHLTQA